MKIVIGYLLAVVAAYVLGAVFVSQGNISQVIGLGFEISFSHRLDAMFHDVTHMYDIYLPLIAIGMATGLGVAALIIRWVPELRMVGYISAGFVALIAIHVMLKAVLGLSGFAPTRELTGLIAQGVAGAAGGFVFHYLTLARTTD